MSDGGGSRRSYGPVRSESLKEKRRKHNEVEIRRRQRIRESFDELADLLKVADKKKRVVLESAIQTIGDLREREARMEAAIAALGRKRRTEMFGMPSPAPPSGDVPGSAGGPAASSAAAAAASTVTLPDAGKGESKDGSVSVDHAAVFDGAGAAMGVSTFDGRFIDANPALLRLLKRARGEVVAQPSTTLFTMVRHEHLASAFQLMSDLMSSRRVSDRRLVLNLPDGSEVSVTVTAWTARDVERPTEFVAVFVPVEPAAGAAGAAGAAAAPQ